MTIERTTEHYRFSQRLMPGISLERCQCLLQLLFETHNPTMATMKHQTQASFHHSPPVQPAEPHPLDPGRSQCLENRRRCEKRHPLTRSGLVRQPRYTKFQQDSGSTLATLSV